MNRVVWSSSRSVYENLALEERLMRELGEDETVLYLWINDNCVVLGSNQCAFLECDLRFCEENGISVARRLSGGGCVYQDAGNVNFSFIYRRAARDDEPGPAGAPSSGGSVPGPGGSEFGFSGSPGQPGPFLLELVRGSLERLLSRPVESSGNDLLIDGCKISGLAYCEEADKVLLHGTLLVDVDREMMSRALTVSTKKLESKGIDSVSKRVANLSDWDREVTPQAAAEEISRAFICSCGSAETVCMAGEGGAAADRYRSRDWIWGESPDCRTVLEIEGRSGLYQLVCDVEDGKIRHAALYSDADDAVGLAKITARMEGMEYREDILTELLA